MQSFYAFPGGKQFYPPSMPFAFDSGLWQVCRFLRRYSINIDLAGRRTPGPQGLRVVSAIRPPWLAFDYVLQNPSGRTIASGSQRLVARAPASSSKSRYRPVQIEADMMQRWLQTLRIPQ